MPHLEAQIKFDGPEGLGRREMTAIGKETMAATGLRHRRRNLHHHFEKRAVTRYGYAHRRGDRNPRKPGTYSNRKLRLFSHIKPLVWSGELRRLTLQGLRLVAVVARGAGELVAKLKLPRKANLRNPKSKTNPLKELRAFAQSETQDLDQFFGDDLDRRISRKR